MALQDQAIYINNEAINGSAILRLYDVTDLITPVRNFPGQEVAFNGGGDAAADNLFGGGAAPEEGEAKDPEELVSFIRNNVTRTEWDDAKNISIQQRSGSTLFVSHTPEGHKLIEQLLSNMRSQSAMQVNVSVRLLDVRKGFFEEIGFEFHNNPQNMIAAADSRDVGFGTVGREGGAGAGGYAVIGTVRQQMPGNASSVAYGINPTDNASQPRGLVLEGALNTASMLNAEQVNVIFSAAEDESDATILSHPQISCFNGQRANAAFINQYAYIMDYEVVSGNYDPVIRVMNVGSVLDVRPVISSDRKYITMEIRPTNVLLAGVFTEFIVTQQTAGGTGNGGVVIGNVVYPIELPNVEVQTLRSTAMLPDRGSLLIGGFNRTQRQRTHSGVPFLSHIPFLGRLFSRNGTYDESRKTFYLLTATVLDLNEQEKLQ
jgi:type II secretory pathway component GspD/PulD (secretin)